MNPLGRLWAQDLDSTPRSCQWLLSLAHLRPGGASPGPTARPAWHEGWATGGLDGSFSISTERRLRPGSEATPPEKATARPANPSDSQAGPPLPSRRILTGERPRAGETRAGAPAAGGCSPGGPRGTGKERDTGARRRPRKTAPVPPSCPDRCPRPGPGVPAPHPAAVPVPPTARGASRGRPSRSCGLSPCPALRRRRALGARHQLAAESGRPRSKPRARALVPRSRQSPFFYRQQLSPCMPRSSEREARADGQLRRRCSPSSVGAPKSLSPAKKLFRLLPALMRKVPARRSLEAGCGAQPRVHWPARRRRPEST